MVVPAYTDISHFRAPYKNAWPYTGISGFGQEAAVVEPGAPPPPPAIAEFVEEKAGKLYYRPETADALLKKLEAYRAVFLSDRAVKLVLFSEQEREMAAADPTLAAQLQAQSGAAWCKKKLAEGNVVFATLGVLVPGASEPQLAAVPKGETETVKMTSHIAPILAEPGLFAALMTPVGLVATAVVGGVVVLGIWGAGRRRRRRG